MPPDLKIKQSVGSARLDVVAITFPATKETKYWVPFKDKIAGVFLLPEDRVIAISRSAEIKIYDYTLQTTTQQTKSSAINVWHALLDRAGSNLYFIGYNSFNAYDTKTLTERFSCKALRQTEGEFYVAEDPVPGSIWCLAGGPMHEMPDGRILARWRHQDARSVVIIDPVQWMFRLLPIPARGQDSSRHFSPGGVNVVIPYRVPIDPAAPQDRGFLPLDACPYVPPQASQPWPTLFGHILEVWDIESSTFSRKILCGHYAGGRVSDVLWEDDRTFWCLIELHILTRINLDRGCGPLFVFTRWSRANEPMMLPDFMSVGGAKLYHDDEGLLCIETGLRGTVKLPARHNSTVSSEPVFINPDEDNFIDVIEDKGAKEFVRNLTSVIVPLGELSTAAVATALRLATERFNKEKLVDLVHNSVLQLSFRLKRKKIGEIEVSNFLVEHSSSELIESLRALLNAYLAQSPRDIWFRGEEGEPALCYMLRALVLLDHASCDIFRAFLESIDDEHETFVRHKLFPAYIKKHGWAGPAAFSLGLHLAIRDDVELKSDDLWNKHHLLDAAEKALSADEFTRLAVAELNQARAARIERLYESFLNGLPKKKRPYFDRVREALDLARAGGR